MFHFKTINNRYLLVAATRLTKILTIKSSDARGRKMIGVSVCNKEPLTRLPPP